MVFAKKNRTKIRSHDHDHGHGINEVSWYDTKNSCSRAKNKTFTINKYYEVAYKTRSL
jgi:hypothetical protein